MHLAPERAFEDDSGVDANLTDDFARSPDDNLTLRRGIDENVLFYARVAVSEIFPRHVRDVDAVRKVNALCNLRTFTTS